MYWIQYLISDDYRPNTKEYIYIYIEHRPPRLINIRYTYDIILYAKSFNELETMTEKFMNDLRTICLHLNATKTQILRFNPSEDDSILNFNEISNFFLKMLDDDESYRFI